MKIKQNLNSQTTNPKAITFTQSQLLQQQTWIRLTTSPETKKRTPNGTTTIAAGIAINEHTTPTYIERNDLHSDFDSMPLQQLLSRGRGPNCRNKYRAEVGGEIGQEQLMRIQTKLWCKTHKNLLMNNCFCLAKREGCQCHGLCVGVVPYKIRQREEY